MRIIARSLSLLLMVVLLSGCAVFSGKQEQEPAKVHCPACETDFDALFFKRY
ncbi:MAG: hypothetical protein RQ723_11655 [Desulfuromonadales bacterium]|nr:hypothetical protein [Desulfuromonadales bacterium]